MARQNLAKSLEAHHPLLELETLGQSVWLDFIDRNLVKPGGQLQKLIDTIGLKGITSNPTLFEHAISEGKHYEDQIKTLLSQRDWEVKELYEEIAAVDIAAAADLLRPVYERTQGADGYACLEVSPNVAYSSKKTIEEARYLWSKVNRPNIMIKVPGTPEGVSAIRTLLTEGINVNITLLFSQEAYHQVAQAHLEALEARVSQGKSIDKIASVASFFVSRIDTKVDSIIQKKLQSETQLDHRNKLQALLGKIAIANAKLAYSYFQDILASERWKKLEQKKAHPQRLLWASTGVKNKDYSDVLYVESLIGPATVNTLPLQTLQAFDDHGTAKPTLQADLEEARKNLEALDSFGISLTEVTRQLSEEGVTLFNRSFEKLMASLERKKRAIVQPGINTQSLRFSLDDITAVGEVLQSWKNKKQFQKFWDRDASVWTHQDENNWLGWLEIVEKQIQRLPELLHYQKEFQARGFRDAVVLGMGGSSLCPEVLSMTFEPSPNAPDLHILDSTDPDQIHALEQKLDLKRTLFIVSSKSGTTLEPNLFFEYFFHQMKQTVGEEVAPSHFIAITDPGSQLEKYATQLKFWRIFHGEPSIGGRYSALSDFGMIPAAIVGVNLEKFLTQALQMVHACSPNVPPEENPGMILGAALGTQARIGRNKITLITSPEIWDMSAWLEQLLAESTGKMGRGLIPVSDEKIGHPRLYEDDRVFIYLRMSGSFDRNLDTMVQTLAEQSHPVIQIDINNSYSLGQEFYRWEIATAVAGSILEINPFDQPDVESSKEVTRKLMKQFESQGMLPSKEPFFEEDGIQLYTDEANLAELNKVISGSKTLASYLSAHLSRINACDYFAILAYLNMNFDDEEVLRDFRHQLRDAKRVATCLEFGPRYLHSTGQVYKGGPNLGVFLQITADSEHDLPIPGHPYQFGTVKMAQALGDLEVLQQRKRRCLRVHLGKNRSQVLKTLHSALISALNSEKSS